MLYRLADPADWDRARQTGFFASADLAAEGFIHTSARTQVLETARRYYAGRPDLVLLEIDDNRLSQAGVRVEQVWVAGRQATFGHVYGAVPLAAITRVFAFGLDAHGEFSLPAELHSDAE